MSDQTEHKHSVRETVNEREGMAWKNWNNLQFRAVYPEIQEFFCNILLRMEHLLQKQGLFCSLHSSTISFSAINLLSHLWKLLKPRSSNTFWNPYIW